MIEVDKNRFNRLIENIAPLNNEYRDRVHLKGSGTVVLELMWRVGEILELFLTKEKIKPHTLYWQIYGKAPGLKRSYITRDFLSYCLRVKRFFRSSGDIRTMFPNLKQYSLFREAFPLLENPKYKLIGDEQERLVRILNSNSDPSKIRSYVVNLKNERIGVRNPRTQRLNELKGEVDSFIGIFNYAYELIKENNADDIGSFRDRFSDTLILAVSRHVAALTQEGLAFPAIDLYNHLPEHWVDFIDNLKRLAKSTVETRNRFRRLIPPGRIMDLADMLNAVMTDQGIKDYRLKKSLV